MVDGNPNYHVSTVAKAIDIDGITRFFGSTCAVNDLSFSVAPGEVVGFIGPNGAGKTTTMRILSTLDEPDVGDATIDGFSVVNDPDRVRFRLGFMPDAYGAYRNVTCVEYLDFFARAYGLVGMERTSAIRRVIEFTGMQDMLDKPMNGLSKGMKQRLCLGRALVHDPAVLILDEPAAGLDPRARIELRDMINGLVDRGKSILISSHILTELAEVSHRVAIIERGILLAWGSVDEILSRVRTAPPDGGVGGPAEKMITVDIDLLEPDDAIRKVLIEHPRVQKVESKGSSLAMTLPDDAALHQMILAMMIERGAKVHRFAARRRSLEEAFLHVTKGRVQ